ncbi:MAG TPA: inositol 2-dehydrogenase [Solirubrobacter sp.]|nr:inositol 2-dehydrogenase [Solirubrobacter sp.]
MVERSNLRVGILGTGRIGRLHAELLARQVAGADLTCVHDAHAPSARTVADRLGAVAAPTPDALIAAVDAVAICTPTDTHADLIVAAARAGRAIFCEKPVSLDLATVDRVLAAVDAAHVPFQIGFNRRFDPAHAAVAAAVADGTVGEPHLARISSRDPDPPSLDYVRHSGGLFLDMTIHDFDMARFVVGAEIVEVFARAAVRVDPAMAAAGDVDTAVVTLVHANGCLTTIDNSRRARYGYDQRVEVFGSEGMASSANPLAHTATVATAAGLRAPPLPTFFLDRYVPSYVREWEAFVAAVAAGTAPPVGAADARAPLVAGLAAWRSVRERRPVSVAEI